MAYGVAIDIGTTTISGSLLNLETGAVDGRFSALNGQLSYGHDIISRINHALYKKNGARRLTDTLVSTVNFVLEELIKTAEIEGDSVCGILAVGNSVMYHFLFSLPVDSFTTPPYKPYKTGGMEIEAAELGIESAPKARLKMLPNINGFIGSDAIAVMLATGLYKEDECALAMDIGTNGEIILGSKDRVLVVSTAAGPAFESWHIGCGMRPVEGAIERAEDRDGKIHLGVVGGGPPKGISGSGLIDLTAILLKRGEIDSAGRLRNENFLVYDGARQVIISQKDVREAQLAKAAFSAGIKFLRARKPQELSRIYVTGTFGNYINKKNAQFIGLVPEDVELSRIEFIKDGALTGAEKFLAEPGLQKDIEDILGMTEHVSLAENKDFQAEFAGAMRFQEVKT